MILGKVESVEKVSVSIADADIVVSAGRYLKDLKIGNDEELACTWCSNCLF
jgi:hypothetical protein